MRDSLVKITYPGSNAGVGAVHVCIRVSWEETVCMRLCRRRDQRERLGFQQVTQKLLIIVPLDESLHLAAACSLSLAMTWSV